MDDRAEQIVRSLIANGDEIAWSALPYLWLRRDMTSHGFGPIGITELSRHGMLTAVGHLGLTMALRPDGILAAWGSVNQERTLRPILEHLAASDGNRPRISNRFTIGRRPALATAGAPIRLARQFAEGFEAANLTYDTRERFLCALFKASRAIQTSMHEARVLSCGNTTDPACAASWSRPQIKTFLRSIFRTLQRAQTAIYRDLPFTMQRYAASETSRPTCRT